MTDEKKAEEYTNSIDTIIYDIEDNAINIALKLRKAYLGGLAEGRKEKCFEQNNDGTIRPCEVMKENEQLKCDLYNTDANLQHITIEYEKENAELKKDKEWLDNTNNEQTKVILELQAQIEKMKSFIHSEIDFCMYCPLTNECRNDEGTCPYAYATEEEQKNLLLNFIQNWEPAE